MGKIADADSWLKRPFCFRAAGLSLLFFAGSMFIPPQFFPASGLQQAQPLRHDVNVVNIEVSVRVFDGDVFVENLAYEDFEVFENGVRQELQAVYFIKNSTLARKEEKKAFTPDTGRNFFLVFRVFDYDSKLGEAIGYFTQNILRPEDNLVVVTPVKTYRLKRNFIKQSTKAAISDGLCELVRHDVLIGNGRYRALLDELTRMITGGGVDRTGSLEPDLSLFGEGSWQEFLSNYRDVREQLDRARSFATDDFLSLGAALKKMPGQKIVLLFCQSEFVPMVDRKKYIGMFEDAADFLTEQNFHDLFDIYHRDSKLDVQRIKKEFSDVSISIHFLFISNPPPRLGGFSNAAMEEHSEDIFSNFFEVAKATGGLAESSSNPVFLMQKSGIASDNYYLLYYVPSDSKADGTFRNIKVLVKNKKYSVLCRAGYFSK